MKKHKLRRVLSLVLSLAMVLGLTPTAAFAAEGGDPVTTDSASQIISEIKVSGLDGPVIGEHPDFQVSIPQKQHYHLGTCEEAKAAGFTNASSFVNGVRWMNMADPLSESHTFADPSVYHNVHILLFADEGFRFADESALEATLEGDYMEMLVSVSDTGSYCIITALEPLPTQARKLSSVQINDLSSPVHGAHPDFEVTLPENCGYHLATAEEMKSDELKALHVTEEEISQTLGGVLWKMYALDVMTPDDTFDQLAGTAYPATIFLVADPGYTFGPVPSALVDGSAENISASTTSPDGRFAIIYVKSMAAVAPPEWQNISLVRVNHLRMPVLGAHPDFDVTLPENCGYHLASSQELTDLKLVPKKARPYVRDGIMWTAKGSGPMNPTDTFLTTDQDAYTVSVFLVADKGASFNSTKRPTIQLNDSEASVLDGTDFSAAHLSFDAGPFTATEPSSAQEISLVDVTELTLPVLGATPVYEVTMPENCGYHAMTAKELTDLGLPPPATASIHNGVAWIQIDSGPLAPTDTFSSSKESNYVALLYLTADDGYSFRPVKDLTVKLNGQKKLVADAQYNSDLGVLMVAAGPFTASAAQEILLAEVTGMTIPAVGEHPDFSWTIPEGAPYRFATAEEIAALSDPNPFAASAKGGVIWVHLEGISSVAPMNQNSTFLAGETNSYMGSVYLVPKDGYYFSANTVRTINGDASLVNTGYQITDGVLPVCTTAFVPGREPITELSIDDLRKPAKGQRPDYTVSLPIDAPYHLATPAELKSAEFPEELLSAYRNGVAWHTGTLMYDPDEVFPDTDQPIKAIVALVANDGYTFAGKAGLSAAINGSDYQVTLADCTTTMVLVESAAYSVESVTIPKVDLLDLDAPVKGQKLDYTVNLPADAGYHLATETELRYFFSMDSESLAKVKNGLVWMAGNMPMDPGATAQNTALPYHAVAVLVANPGSQFVSGKAFSGTLNGSAAQCDSAGPLAVVYSPSYSIAPVSPSAITRLQVTDLAAPVKGQKADYTVTLPENAGYHLATAEELEANGVAQEEINSARNGVAWMTSQDKNVSPNAILTDAGVQYRAAIALVADEGRSFAPSGDLTYSVNGNSAGTRLGLTTTKLAVVISPVYRLENSSEKNLISKLDISDLAAPAAGKKADYNVTLPENAGYHLATSAELEAHNFGQYEITNTRNGVAWIASDGGLVSPDAAITDPSLTYNAAMVLIADEGYSFKPRSELKYTLNGSSSNGRIGRAAPDIVVVFSPIYTLKQEPQKVIREVAVSGLTIPVWGASPDFSVSVPKKCHYHFASVEELGALGYDLFDFVGDVSWWNYSDGSDGAPLDRDSVFNEQGLYDAFFVLVPDDGYIFAPMDELTATLNGSADLLEPIDSNNFSVDGVGLMTNTFTVSAPGGPKEISHVAVSGLELPAWGSTPDFKVNVPAGAHYHLATAEEAKAIYGEDGAQGISGGMWWLRESTALTGSDVFDDDFAPYWAEFLLVADEGYWFDDQLTADVNGDSDLASHISDNGSSASGLKYVRFFSTTFHVEDPEADGDEDQEKPHDDQEKPDKDHHHRHDDDDEPESVVAPTPAAPAAAASTGDPSLLVLWTLLAAGSFAALAAAKRRHGKTGL